MDATLKTTSPAPPTRASRLSEERRRVIYAAIRELLREVGFDALTMDMISARAHAGKATLYRRWTNKSHLVAAALSQTEQVRIDTIDTGTPAGDLDEVAVRAGERAAEASRLLSSMVHTMRDNAELEEAMRRHFIDGQLDGLRGLLSRAVRRGEVAEHCPALPHFPHLVISALLSQRMLTGHEPDTPYLRDYFTSVVLPSLNYRSASTPGEMNGELYDHHGRRGGDVEVPGVGR